MHLTVILRVLGILLMLYSLSMLTPAFVGLYYNDGFHHAFFSAFFIVLMLGVLCWIPVNNHNQALRTRDGFLIAVLYWVVLGLVGAVPFLLLETYGLSFTDAIFESISGLTTTGATIITDIDSLPKSILFYRQQLQWLGGMGIVVLAVAILPMLGVGGMQLYRAETPGPVKDSKLTPRITETAKVLWYIYASLTAICAICYWLAGMSGFDAICHSFSTVAIGGFSTHDASIGYFNNTAIELITVLFMLIAATNFGLHFYAWQHKTPSAYFKDTEFRFYIAFILLSILVCTALLFGYRTYQNPFDALRYASFTAVSITTTTGYGVADFSVWPPLIATLLLMGSFIGGCAASTGGGMKAIRVILIFKQASREIKRLVHPAAVTSIKLGRTPVDGRVIEAVWGFFAAYIFLFAFLFLAILATGLDFVTGFSAVVACLNNLGPGLGDVAGSYSAIPDSAKAILCIAMILGRLEIFTLLVVLSPVFWRN